MPIVQKCGVAVVLVLACASVSAATHAVKINADGSFSPALVYIASGDTVEWTLSGPGDSIIPVNWNGTLGSFCSAVKPFAASDPNEFTGPMPQAVSGILALSPLGVGFVVEPSRSVCSSGQPPAAVAAGQMLCRGLTAAGATMDATWQDPSVTGVFIRLLWKDIQIAPGTSDASFDFTILDREVSKAVKNGKVYSLGIKAGDDGTPDWLFTSGVTPLQLQDSGDDAAGCGVRMTLGSPTQITYQNHYFDLLRKVASHLRARADWYRALAYIKPSGANLLTHENRLPKRCSSGCICNTQVFAEHGYTPNGLYAFYQAQTALLASEFPEKTMGYALIQEGFPRINNSGGYEKSDGTSSGGTLPGGTEQTQVILNNGQAAHGLRFAVAHNGLTTKKTDNCLANINAAGCPNKFVLQEGLEGQVTGWQTNNDDKVANPADVDSALQNALSNSQGVYVELYEERVWEALRQPNGIVDPAGSGRTMSQWADQFHSRRRALFPTLPDPFPPMYRHTFTRTIADNAGHQTFYYVHGSKCGAGSAAPASIVLLAPGENAPTRRRAARH
ncbi:MAG TPA: hypothetical protein VGR02_07600 [Thermoanaerobaculia bacterium]|jgi:hypothetical protein|nr:hypothetical protein [Thermoanaerobaculia bacterium]